MQDKDIRRLFQKAEIQVCPEQKRILKMYEYLQNEIDKNEYKNKKQRKILLSAVNSTKSL